ncbi:hypothetical protein D3C81_1601250 [compost metagenome]
MDWRKCQVCAATGNGRLLSGNCRSGRNGICIGVGLPVISVSTPNMLWKYGMVRRPPFHHVEYTLPPLDTAPGLFSCR